MLFSPKLYILALLLYNVIIKRFLVDAEKIKLKFKEAIFEIKEMDKITELLKDEFEVYKYSRNTIDVCRKYLNDKKIIR